MIKNDQYPNCSNIMIIIKIHKVCSQSPNSHTNNDVRPVRSWRDLYSVYIDDNLIAQSYNVLTF